MSADSTPSRRILLIDDTDSIHDDFRRALQGGAIDPDLAADEEVLFGAGPPTPARQVTFDIDSAYQGQEGCRLAQAARDAGQPYAMAFVDMRMPPGWDGLETICELWRIDPMLEVVICSAYSDYSWDQIINRLGVNDQLLILKKPFDAAETAQVALALTEKWRLAQQLQQRMAGLTQTVAQRNEELRHAALHDRLTGLANRYQLEQRLDEVLAQPADFCLLFLDFDRFKIINDTLGHTLGDQLLMETAGRLSAELAVQTQLHKLPPGVAARMGGDEFVVLLEGTDDPQVGMAIAQEINRTLRDPFEIEGRSIHITASVGLTSSRHGYANSDEVLRDADAAMYRAKSLGKDRCALFDSAIHQQMVQRLQLETELREALEANQLAVWHQPLVCLSTGRIIGFEALLRWRHPEHGLIAPGKFIPIAEETGLIVPIGKYVLRQAAAQLHLWQKRFPRPTPLVMNVNLSKRQLLEPGLLGEVAGIIRGHGLYAGSLHLEVTESVIMDQPEAAAPLLEELRRLGVGIAMDDFGTGQSSLHCLNRFPLDVLKIDRAFVKQMEDHRAYGAVIQAIITLAQNLNVSVTAEGIETEGQLAQLQALDCQHGQGWLFAKALPAADCERLLEADAAAGWARKLVEQAALKARQWQAA